jgi:tRNA (cmo5U34)-methyltransferase
MKTKKTLADSLDKDVKRILDLGAGTGLELIYLYEKYPNVHTKAIDISQKMLDKIKERDFSDKVELICGDLFTIDYGTNIDAVISTSALHHFIYDEKVKLYKKIYNCLKEDGVFINCDKIVLNNEEEIKCLENNENKVNVHNDIPLTVEHEKELLNNAGFNNIEVKETDHDNYRLFLARK